MRRRMMAIIIIRRGTMRPPITATATAIRIPIMAIRIPPIIMEPRRRTTVAHTIAHTAAHTVALTCGGQASGRHAIALSYGGHVSVTTGPGLTRINWRLVLE